MTGFNTRPPHTPSPPYIYLHMSYHGRWIFTHCRCAVNWQVLYRKQWRGKKGICLHSNSHVYISSHALRTRNNIIIVVLCSLSLLRYDIKIILSIESKANQADIAITVTSSVPYRSAARWHLRNEIHRQSAGRVSLREAFRFTGCSKHDGRKFDCHVCGGEKKTNGLSKEFFFFFSLPKLRGRTRTTPVYRENSVSSTAISSCGKESSIKSKLD